MIPCDVAKPAGSTLVDILRWRAEQQPDQRAFTFLADGEGEERSLTYQELDRQAQGVALLLRGVAAPGDRALLVYPPGLDYIIGFFGCLYSGLVAVPVYPPDRTRLNRTVPRLQAIASDAEATAALTTQAIISLGDDVFDAAPDLKALRWLASDRPATGRGGTWRKPSLSRDSIAFLQYTSGSTGSPKGVMVSHANLLHNAQVARQLWGHTEKSILVSWLPLYHDMGLIAAVLGPVCLGFPSVLLSPIHFVQRPVRWLNAISRYGGTTSGGPNFAYDLCVRKVTPAQRAGLDLSKWRSAFNGAEPVRVETLDRFAATFGPCGFRRESLLPSYGLAEATLIVSAVTAERAASEDDEVVEVPRSSPGASKLVSVGRTVPDQEIAIVDPESLERCLPGNIGEIWVAGPSVAQGYWKRPVETERTFRGHIAGTREGPFLRTGDLGFSEHGRLYITGRMKDLIIIRGNNHYPQDIELTMERSHSALRRGCGAAFSLDIAGEERLTVVQEIDPDQRPDLEEVIGAVRNSIAEIHDLQAHAVVLIEPRSIPKTSSGKIQRRTCRADFLGENLHVVKEWRAPVAGQSEEIEAVSGIGTTDATMARTGGPAAAAIEEWLLSNLSDALGVKRSDLDVRRPFSQLGLDSLTATTLTGDLATWLGRSLPPTLAWDYPNIEGLARHLSGAAAADLQRQPSVVPVQPSEKDPIAIIGMGCRFPGADNPEAFWKLLRSGTHAICEIPADRWAIDEFYHPDPGTPGKMNSRHGGFLEAIDRFDPQFFGISPREAAYIDPQHRLLLEVAWEALEEAGCAPAELAGSNTGIFIGISSGDYSRLQYGHPAAVGTYSSTGNSYSIAANRISYALDLRGVSMAVDTACSSSLVAVDLACQNLRQRKVNLALAGGVNVILSPEISVGLCQARMLSSKGRCGVFDAEADGYVRGEGCGIVVLKRLADAISDGDNIRAIIRGSAVNQDGRSNGLTAPNGPAQEKLIRDALAGARVTSTAITYVEAHGTGTPLGDPIEFQALASVLGDVRSDGERCAVGSVKGNIGHLEAAAGIAGLIKVVLALQHEEIPPHLHLNNLNPHIPSQTAAVIRTKAHPWPAGVDRRFAGISSFGFGGTNAHVILEEGPVRTEAHNEVERPLHVLGLSAQSNRALIELAKRYRNHLAGHSAGSLSDVCFTANTGRSHFDHRLGVAAQSLMQLREGLEHFISGKETVRVRSHHVQSKRPPKVAFVFTGQGSQHPGMAREIYETQSTFRAALNRCREILRPHFEGADLLSYLYPAEGQPSRLDETWLTQPALFSLEYALAQLWLSWGIRPDAVVGHSVGECVAACVAGVFSLEDGLGLVAARGRLMGALPRNGSMAVVKAPESVVLPHVETHATKLSIAAYNAPGVTVLSGETSCLRRVLGELKEQGFVSRSLATSHAFHSPLMEPMLSPFEAVLRKVRFRSPNIDLVSNTTGRIVTEFELNPEYWLRHVRSPVRFAESVALLAERGYRTFLELGPRHALCSLIRRILDADVERAVLPSLSSGSGGGSGADDWNVLASSLLDLYTRGHTVDWKGFDRDYERRKVSLPTYAFDRERYWVSETRPSVSPVIPRVGERPAENPLPSVRGASAAPKDGGSPPETGVSLSPHAVFLREHQVRGVPTLPAAAHLGLVFASSRRRLSEPVSELRDVAFTAPLSIDADDGNRQVRVLFDGSADSDGRTPFRIVSFPKANPSRVGGDGLAAPAIEAVRLEIGTPGLLEELSLRATSRAKPRSGEVEIEVVASGLNFMDVMNALGVLPVRPGSVIPLGAECAGRIAAVGGGVEEFRIGDEVIAIAPGSLASHVRTAGDLVVAKPTHLSFEEAATIPVCFLTAHYALNRVGRLAPGERVLIHAAAGGVGLAAVQLAQLAHAEIFATAGSSVKREFLESMGVQDAMDSRSMEFAEVVLARTRGEGVDVVLNSLAGEAIAKSLSILRAYGRFLEIGKADIYKNSHLGLEPFQNNLSFAAIDLERMCRERPALIHQLFLEIMAHFQAGKLRPLPLRAFPLHDAGSAFRHMAQRRNIGKVLLLPGASFESAADSGVIEHARGGALVGGADVTPAPLEIESIRARCAHRVAPSALYSHFRQMGIRHGSCFQSIESLQMNEREVLASILLPDAARLESCDSLNPFLMDGALQALGAWLCEAQTEGEDAALYVPFAVNGVRVFGPLPDFLYAYGVRRDGRPAAGRPPQVLRGDLKLADREGRILVTLDGICLNRVQPGSPIATREKPVAPCLWRLEWKRTPLGAAGPWKNGTWLMFMDEFGVGEALSRGLRDKGDTCIAVRPGTEFAARGALDYSLKPDSPDDYRLLVQRLAANGATPTAMVHLWACSSSARNRLGTLEELDRSLHRGIHSLLFATQAFTAGFRAPMSYWLVTTDGQAVDHDAAGAIAPQNASVWALGKVIAEEYSRVRSMGVDLAADAQSAQEMASLILGEIEQEAVSRGAEPWVAYRGGERWTRELVRVEHTAEASQPLPLCDAGVYLITGGQGGIGLELAKFIAGRVKAKLVLLNRTALEEHQHSDRSEGMRALQALGAEVMAVRADVTDLVAMRRVIEQVVARWGRLDGVIHSAGVLRDAPLVEMDRRRFEEVLRPKVHGTWVVDRVTAESPLDFFVVCSSMASLLGLPGQSNHVAANAFEDAFAHHRARTRSQRTLSINWGAWGETGVVSSSRYQKALAAHGIPCLSNAEGVLGFEHALKLGLAQVGICHADDNPADAREESLVDEAEPLHCDRSVSVDRVRPDLAQIAERVRTRVPKLNALYGLDRYEALAPELDALSASYVLRTLQKLGWQPRLREHGEPESVMRRLGITAEYRRLFRRMWEMLRQETIVREDGAGWEVLREPSMEDPQAQLTVLLGRYPAWETELTLLGRCGNSLPEVLVGACDPLSLLFPEGSLAAVEALYEESPFSRFCNTLAQDAVAAAVGGDRSGGAVRILEIGAGTGATTRHLLSGLAARDVEYVFTDVSPLFVQRAKRKFEYYPSIRYRLLDIERDPSEQDFALHQFDVIVAANVLHATADLREVLGHVKTLLASEGLLVLVEAVRPQRWLDLVFGLTQGWWKFADADIRPDHPLLSASRWGTLLEQEGFEAVATLGRDRSRAPSDHAVILAQGPRLVGRSDAFREKLPSTHVAPPSRDATGPVPPASSGENPSLLLWVQQRIAVHVGRALCMEPGRVDLEASFRDVGLDSLMGVEVSATVKKEMGIPLTPTLLYEYPSITELSSYLVEHYEEMLRPRTVVEARPPVPISTQETSVEAQALERVPAITPPNAGSHIPSASARVTPPMAPVRPDDIAVIGLACRFPEAPDLDSFWRLLCSGKDAITEIPPDRWNWRDYVAEGRGEEGTSISRWGGFLTDIARFDPQFFAITPREATLMDPQQRIFLETAWHALEHAGYGGDRLAGSETGVFVGCSGNDYLDIIARSGRSADYGAGLGNSNALLPNRVSYFFNFQGPSVCIDTLCSSSLVALHMACQSVMRGECPSALVGGVNILLSPSHYVGLSRMKALAADGRCKVFDHRADGFTPAEGSGAVLIKPLARALEDGDRVYAVVKGGALNHDGRSNGLTAPNPRAQARLISTAYRAAGIGADSISYVEAHGTGTSLGDPIEFEGLTRAFAECTDRKQFCAIGSVKATTGHLEAASGIAGFIKVVLALQHRKLPPSLHFERPNPLISFEESPFTVNTKLREWEAFGPRRAGISSFGIGGANVHVVVEEAPRRSTTAHREREMYLLPLSARSRTALNVMVTRYRDYLKSNPEISLLDLCYTASIGRACLRHRVAILAEARQRFVEKLQMLVERPEADLRSSGIFRRFAEPGELAGEDPGTGSIPSDSAEDLPVLAERFVRGEPTDWQQLYAGDSPQRVALPIYPFEGKRCWIEENPGRIAAGTFETAPAELPDDDVDTPAHLSSATANEIEVREGRPDPRRNSNWARRIEQVAQASRKGEPVYTDEEVWLDPTPVSTTSDHLATIARLSSASSKKYHDSESGIDWTNPSGDLIFKTEDSLALYGTPYWELLDDAERRRLAFLEVLHSWHSFVAVETFAVTLQSNIVLKEYTDKAQGIPEEVTRYWIHFCKEELVHTLMFRRALRHFECPKFSDEITNARLLFGGLKWASVATLALLFEWFQEELQWRTSTGAGIDPLTNQIVTSHHVEEARHIRFGREVTAGFWRSQPSEEREKIIPLIVAAVRVSLDDLTAHKDVLAAMNFERPEFRDLKRVQDVANTCEYRVEFNKRIFGRIFSFLRDVDIYNRSAAPVFAKGKVDHYFTSA